MFAEPLYVGYRTYLPDNGIINKVKLKLQENDIDMSELEEWPVDHCLPGEFSTPSNGGNGT